MDDKLEWQMYTKTIITSATALSFNERLEGYLMLPKNDIVPGYHSKDDDELMFASRSFGTHTEINGNCYLLPFNKSTTHYLMDISGTPDSVYDNEMARDIWIGGKGVSPSFLVGSRDSESFDEAIDILFTAIEEYIDRPKIPSDYLSAIDAFMNNEKDY